MKSTTLIAAAFFAALPSLTLADTAKDQAAIQAVFAKFGAAWKAGDAKARAALFAEDATIINPFGMVAVGREAIEARFMEENKTIAHGTTHSAKAGMIRFSGDLAFVDAEITISGLMGPDGKPAPDLNLRGVFQFIRKAGAWMILDGRPNQLPKYPATK